MGESKVKSVEYWFVNILVASIPIIGFIMLLIWAFGDKSDQNRKNWAKATIIFFGVISILLLISIGLFFWFLEEWVFKSY